MNRLKQATDYVRGFALWLTAGAFLGILGGLVGAAFGTCIRLAAGFRAEHPRVIWLLPIGGLCIALLYGSRRLKPTDTNGILLAIHRPADIPAFTAPVIFISTVITHFFGGSAGREGAALQLGGVLGNSTAKLLHLKDSDTRIAVMAGMSAVFAALFGTPLTAAIFAMEVASVGLLHFSAIIPCFSASLTAAYLAQALGLSAESFPLHAVPAFAGAPVAGVIAVSAAGALLSVLFCVSLHEGTKTAAKLLPNPYLRIAAGGLLLAVLTFILGTTDYNGAGTPLIEAAIEGHARWEAFILKLLFTVITMSCGYKGGEIVPAMFIGSTMGCCLATILGLDPGLGAAVGLISMFCGSLHCPISSIFLGIELFGSSGLQYFAIAAAVGYMLSARHSLYHEQKFLYDKIRPDFMSRISE